MSGLWTILLLLLSNTFMTFAWYGHLRMKDVDWFESLGLIAIILISWGIALFEYIFMVPANRIGYNGNGGSTAKQYAEHMSLKRLNYSEVPT